jgi:hypothetical protein
MVINKQYKVQHQKKTENSKQQAPSTYIIRPPEDCWIEAETCSVY